MVRVLFVLQGMLLLLDHEQRRENLPIVPPVLALPRHDDKLDDPRLLFALWPASTVHAVMGLPSVANIRPPLQQGRGKREY